jgi:hypothetical protein
MRSVLLNGRSLSATFVASESPSKSYAESRRNIIDYWEPFANLVMKKA